MNDVLFSKLIIDELLIINFDDVNSDENNQFDTDRILFISQLTE